MNINEWNQMFIESIEHWEVDALYRLSDGDFIKRHADDFERWHSDGAKYTINSDNCALCIAYNCVCKCCPIHDSDQCCHEFEEFYDNKCVDTARHMIETLRYIGQNKWRFEIK